MMQGGEQMSAHLQEQHGQAEHQRDPEAPAHVLELGARPAVGRDHGGFERHAADRAGAGMVLSYLGVRSEEHTFELQSLMLISYAVFLLKKNTNPMNRQITPNNIWYHTIP